MSGKLQTKTKLKSKLHYIFAWYSDNKFGVVERGQGTVKSRKGKLF